MNIQALLGTRPSAGSPRRPVGDDKGRDRDRTKVAVFGDPHDVVELSVEGKKRAATDSGDETP
jgi:hypothetical protein